MKPLNLLLATVGVYCLAAAASIAQDIAVEVETQKTNEKEVKKSVDPSGTWRWEYDMQGETRKDALILNLGKNGKVTGVYVGNGKDKYEIKDGKIDGDKISLEVPLEFEGTEYVIPFTGRIEKDQIKGDVELGGQEYPWSPKRSVMMGDVVGTWHFEIETPDGNVLKPMLVISKKDKELSGVYTSQQGGDLDVKTLKVEKNHLILTVTTEYEGSSVRVDYKARAYGDKMKGELEYDFGGNTGEGEFIAKRKAEKKDTKKRP